MKLVIPDLSLVVLIGPSGAGKSTFARQHFKATEVLSSDVCRGLVSDDENNQAATDDAFDVLHFIATKRLAAGKLTVVDATNLQPDARKPLVALARQYHFVPVAVALDVPESVCNARNQERADRTLSRGAIQRQAQQMRRGLKGLKREGFRYVYTLTSCRAHRRRQRRAPAGLDGSSQRARAVRHHRRRAWLSRRARDADRSPRLRPRYAATS